MIIGFTGTREGLTPGQLGELSEFLHECQEEVCEFHHGGCIGADTLFHALTQQYQKPRIIYPSDLPDYLQGNCELDREDRRLPVDRPLIRNRKIVEACDVLLACPKGPEELHSGTWATVRYGRAAQKRIMIFYPDGHVDEEKGAK